MPITYIINAFTGALDAVGIEGTVGTGTVTSIAEGFGINATPNPIILTGTIDLDINALTTETSLASGDLFAFVDVSVGTTPASQRKVTFSNLISGVNPSLDHGLLLGLADDDHLQYLLLAGRAGGQTAAGGTAASENLTLKSTTHATQGRINMFDTVHLWTGKTSLLTSTEHAIQLDFTGKSYDAATTVFAVVNAEGSLTFTANPTAGDYVLFRNAFTQTQTNAAFNRFVTGSGMNNQPRHFVGTGVTIIDCGTGGATHMPNYQTDGTGLITAGADTGFTFQPIFNGAGGSISGMIEIGLKCGVPGGILAGTPISEFYGVLVESFTIGGTANYSFMSRGSQHNAHLGGSMRIGSNVEAISSGIRLDVFGGYVRGRAGIQVLNGFQVEFFEATNTFHSDFGASAAQAANIDYILPATAPAGVLTNDGAGNLSWAATAPPAAHNFLDSTVHNNTTTGTPVRGDLIVGNTTPAWARFAIGSANRVLRSNGTDPSWAQVVLTTDVTGTLPISNGGTGQTTALAAFNALSPLTTRGDLLTRDTTNNIRLAVGATDKYLRSNGTDPAWADVTELGLVDTYNGQALVSQGVPHILAEANHTGQTADIGTTTLFTPSAAGHYRVVVTTAVTTVASVSSTRPAFNLQYTHGDNATAQTAQPIATNTTNTLTTVTQAQFVIYSAASVAITYTTTGYMSVGGTAMQYSLRVRLERL